MNIIINLPSIGYAIVRDFYTEFVRLFRYVYFYARVFWAVCRDLLTEMYTYINQTVRILQSALRPLPYVAFPDIFSSTLRAQIERWHKTVISIETRSDISLSMIVTVSAGIFLLGCVWFMFFAVFVGG